MRGISADQHAVRGESETGTGVGGYSTSGVAVEGFSREGVGVEAAAPHSGPALALRVSGRAAFNRSGVAVVARGTDRVTVGLVPVTPKTFVLATLQQSRPGVHVAAAVTQPSQSQAVIRLNKAVTADTRVAYLVLEGP